MDYKGTGYAYVEMTEPSLVGVPAEKLAGGVALTSQPDVIRIGDGTLTYGAGAQIAYIQARLAQIIAAGKALRAEIDASTARLKSERASLTAERLRVESITDPQARAAAADAYNQDVARYNADVAATDALIARYNTLVGAERYVAENQTARPQVYARLQSLRL